MECAGLAFKTSGGVVGLVGATAMWTTAFYRSEQPVFDFGRSRPLSQFRYPGHETVRGTALARLATAAWAFHFWPWKALWMGNCFVARFTKRPTGRCWEPRPVTGVWRRIFMWPMSGPNNYGCAPWELRLGIGWRPNSCPSGCKSMKSQFRSGVSFLPGRWLPCERVLHK